MTIARGSLGVYVGGYDSTYAMFMREERYIMNKRDKVKILLPFILFAVLVPIMVDFLIFGNSFPSNIDNDSWAGFLGSFLGAIIGGGCTCWAVIMQKQYADEQRKIDEIAGIRPYIVARKPSFFKSAGNLELDFDIQNIGLNSACDIEIYAINGDWKEPKKTIEQGKYCLTVNSSVHVKPKFNFAETDYYEFHYMDLKSNLYYQEFRYDETTNSFISLEPQNMGRLRTVE